MEELRYRYKVSLAIRHPSMPEDHISAALGLVPEHSGSVGAERRTPKGGPLPGVNKASFWRHSFVAPSDDDLEQFLGLTVSQLEAATPFFKNLIASGGYARLFVGLFLERENIGIEISPDLQSRCSQLGISLGFDIYGPDQPDGAA
ncbi:DUF4279 domain-containing protein [Pseudoxanthomonas suwonensis]|uniref:DUF4279 domain-containing protein n=1 Tax=Pseudoxanthomonas suwonensis TaxID=314722 RepID=UPI0012DCA5B5|nr:DUF4279 domain-containing protein [Pseudoxanthomonas suwonensis]